MIENKIEDVENRKIGKNVLRRERSKLLFTEEFLREQLINQKKSMLRLANETGFTTNTVSRAAKTFNIQTKHNVSRRKTAEYDKIITLEYITKEYIEKQRSTEDIGKELGICPETICKRIKKMGLEVRSQTILTEEEKLNLRWEHLTPIKRHINSKGERVFDNYLFTCSCKKIVSLDWHDVLRGRRTSCGRCNWYEDITEHQWYKIERSAQNRNLEFNITKEYVWDLYIKQDRKCIFTNLPIKFDSGSKSTASVDRKDNSKGYIEGNIQIVHKCLNIMRGSTEDELFRYLCILVARNSNIDESKFQNKEFIKARNTTVCQDSFECIKNNQNEQQ